MARNAWDNVDGVGSARPGVGFWGWVLRLCVVAGLTLAAAFYLPLYRAHKQLTADFTALNERTQSVGQELGAARAELASTKAKRDELEARRGMDQTRERASHELVEQIKTDLASRLARFADKGTLAISIRQGRVVVRFPSAMAESAGHSDATPDARVALCALSAVITSRGAVDVRIVARDDGASADPGKMRSPWELAAERSAAFAHVLVDKCKYPGGHVEAVARPPAEPNAPVGADAKNTVDVEIDPGAGAALTAL